MIRLNFIFFFFEIHNIHERKYITGLGGEGTELGGKIVGKIIARKATKAYICMGLVGKSCDVTISI